jgi:probable rRNA maturation factor
VLSVDVDVIVETPLPVDANVDALGELVRWAIEEEDRRGDWLVAIVLTGDPRLRELHRQFMGIDSETDVMTFPSGEGDDVTGGDIVISVERATAQAPDWGLSAWDEVRFLAVHGALHLCGWRDETEEKREGMLQRQQQLIAAFDARPRP